MKFFIFSIIYPHLLSLFSNSSSPSTISEFPLLANHPSCNSWIYFKYYIGIYCSSNLFLFLTLSMHRSGFVRR